MTTRNTERYFVCMCSTCGGFNCDCKELQDYAKDAAWKRFTQEVEILKIEGFEYKQLMDYIHMKYGRV